MRQGIDIAGQDPILVELFTELKAVNERAEERMKFIQRQADKLCEDVNSGKKTVWDKIKSRLKERGKLPKGYNEDKNGLDYDPGTGLISIIDRDEVGGGMPGLGALLAHLMHHTGPKGPGSPTNFH